MAPINCTESSLPVCAVLSILPLLWPRTGKLLSVQLMGAIALVAAYALVVTTLGYYTNYTELHIPFNPLLPLVTWGSLLAVSLRLVHSRRSIFEKHYGTDSQSILPSQPAKVILWPVKVPVPSSTRIPYLLDAGQS